MKVAMCCIALSSPFAHANLLVNGSFENNTVNDGTWNWFASSNVDGWSGSNVEHWNNFGGMVAQEGDNLAELNSHGSNVGIFSIYQTFATSANTNYDFSFFYAARQSLNESFSVNVFSGITEVFNQVIDDHTLKTWSQFMSEFTALGDETTISFTSITPSTATVGNFIDNVVVTKADVTKADVTDQVSVSTPSILIMTLLSLGLMFVRRT
ncbi:MAG: hypothetical protein ACJA0G_001727 [Kangiellaceae bacterium]|jgi:hypothetical protein